MKMLASVLSDRVRYFVFVQLIDQLKLDFYDKSNLQIN